MMNDDVSFLATSKQFVGGDKEANIYYTVLGSNVSSKGREKLYLQDIADITRIDINEVAYFVNGLISKGNIQAVQDVFDSPLQVSGISQTIQSNLALPSQDNVISLSEHDFVPVTRKILP
jgi:hypothetical protein